MHEQIQGRRWLTETRPGGVIEIGLMSRRMEGGDERRVLMVYTSKERAEDAIRRITELDESAEPRTAVEVSEAQFREVLRHGTLFFDVHYYCLDDGPIYSSRRYLGQQVPGLYTSRGPPSPARPHSMHLRSSAPRTQAEG